MPAKHSLPRSGSGCMSQVQPAPYKYSLRHTRSVCVSVIQPAPYKQPTLHWGSQDSIRSDFFIQVQPTPHCVNLCRTSLACASQPLLFSLIMRSQTATHCKVILLIDVPLEQKPSYLNRLSLVSRALGERNDRDGIRFIMEAYATELFNSIPEVSFMNLLFL